MLNDLTIYDVNELQKVLDKLFVKETFPHKIVSPAIQKKVGKDTWVNATDCRDD